MRAVWSFWTKPFASHRSMAWPSEKHHLLSWVLSVETARRHYPRTALVTDSHGARMLIDALGLEFGDVSTCLDSLNDYHPDWWALGKLHAYRRQRDPFIHIDSDVYLWKRLRPELESADLAAQNPEYFSPDGSGYYRPGACIDALEKHGGWVPEEWRWYSANRGDRAACCGIFGGQNVPFIQYYANLGIKSVEHPRNQAGWASLRGNLVDNLLVEQYSLIACIEYHKRTNTALARNIDMHYLFDSAEAAFEPQRAREEGYTHLIAGAKRNPVLAERLETRVRTDYPEYYEACLRYLNDIDKPGYRGDPMPGGRGDKASTTSRGIDAR